MFGIEKAYYEDKIDRLEECIEKLEKTIKELEIRLSALEEFLSIDIKYNNIDFNYLKKFKYKKMTEIPIILNKKICEYQKKVLNEIYNGDIYVGEIIDMIEEKENK